MRRPLAIIGLLALLVAPLHLALWPVAYAQPWSFPPPSGGAGGGLGGSVGAEDDAILLGDGAAVKPSNVYGSETGEAGLIRIGGKTAGQVAIKHHQGSIIIAQARTADDSAHAAFSGLRPTYNISADSTIGSDITAPHAVITNRTSSAAQKIVTLPASPMNGECYRFVNIDADGLQLDAQGSHVIRSGTAVSSAGGTFTTTDVGAATDLCYIGQGFAWVAVGTEGTWTPA
jgi:hypothetical protein